MSVLLVLFYAVCLLLLTMYLRFRWQYRHVLATAAKLPCPPTLPLIGNAHLFFGDVTACPYPPEKSNSILTEISQRESCRPKFRELKILTVASMYILAVTTYA
ncbi:hypothetical protein J6590_063500 [Homalodisca vitripennis]|nr:hypothetical protein J6590_063500 [Homalodisca vitripennis]